MSKLSGVEQLAELKKQRESLIETATTSKKKLALQIKAELERKNKEQKDNLELLKLNEKIRKLAAVATAEQRRLDARRMIILGRTVIKYLADGNHQLDRFNLEQILLENLEKESEKKLFESVSIFPDTSSDLKSDDTETNLDEGTEAHTENNKIFTDADEQELDEIYGFNKTDVN